MVLRMTKSAKPAPEIVRAAEALEEEMARLETIRLQERMKAYETHMQSFAVLGQAAGALNATLAAEPGDRAALSSAEARLQELAAAALTLFEAARADDFPEIAREADALKQRMLALRKRLARPS
jgi:hypothetical protein